MRQSILAFGSAPGPASGLSRAGVAGLCFLAWLSGAAGCSGDSPDSQDLGHLGDGMVATADLWRPTGALTVTLPQAVDGALWANPTVYPTVPLRISSQGAAAVKVTLAGSAVAVRPGATAGSFLADLPIQALPEGTVKLSATASAPGAQDATVNADLVLGRQGVQFTSFAQVGSSRSAHLHRWNGGLYVTWSDFSQPAATAWMQRIDGAGRPMGTKSPLLPDKDDVLYARVAPGKQSIGVLYQKRGVPYVNFFAVVDFTGKPLMMPLSLDGPGWFGAPQGDIDFDGSGWVAAYRSDPPMGSMGTTSWLRVDEASRKATGPIVVATAGAGTAGDPTGSFEALSFVMVRALSGQSLVSFLREQWSPPLALAIPRSQYALVGQDGVGTAFYGGDPATYFHHWEGRVYRAQDKFLPLWLAVDLNDPRDNPPNIMYAAQVDPTAPAKDLHGAPGGLFAKPSVMVNALDDRAEPFLVEHPEHLGVLVWEDLRSYTVTPDTGHIQLMVAPVGSDLSAGTPIVFDHARFVEGTAELNGVTAGSNVILVWLDERHGRGIAMPTPEVYFETAWF